MLTEGYLRGWLTFDNKTRLSSLREEYILSVLERRLLVDISQTKLGVLGSLTSGSMSQASLATMSKDMSEYFELALPYTAEKTKIRSGHDTAKLNSPDFWRDIFKAEQERATAQNKETPA